MVEKSCGCGVAERGGDDQAEVAGVDGVAAVGVYLEAEPVGGATWLAVGRLLEAGGLAASPSITWSAPAMAALSLSDSV
ncbi:hypothetical protein [Micromonospora sp. 4G55]|uniref:hypothetical protein n=1 Tax=Micromonospora sp. 4G55 TaxID=2806102 RepID=UPI001A515D3A|nr:hypothetical protein [Micromonospora sp. 4G55]MBM0256405.1 hypothetical protein [Micromonospora sp. 4G55]